MEAELDFLSLSKQYDGKPEIFHSVQGEGRSSGKPSVFVRLAFCNLRCIWCDTKYTWDWQHHDRQQQVIRMSVSDVEKLALKFGCSNIVITGGEPLLQQETLIELITLLKNKGFRVEIETNGTITPSHEFTSLVDQWNVSPKLSNSGNPIELREVPQALLLFADFPSASFKYVIEQEEDLTEVEALRGKYKIDKRKISLMPRASDRETLIGKSQWLVEICKQTGYDFSNRLQVFLWENKRGS
jgi:7-cyano-7-deazaguanosine (preQ0) biosynthesis protein QueE